MATVYGENATKLRSTPVEVLGPQEQGGRLRVAYDKYTASGALSLSDVIKMGKLPKGARVVGFWLKSTDLGTGGDVDFGYSASADGTVEADPDAFLDAADVNAAAITHHSASLANAAGLGKKLDAEVDIIVTVVEATSAAGTIETCVYYVID